MAVRLQAGRAQGPVRHSYLTRGVVAISPPVFPLLGTLLTIVLEQAVLILSHFAAESTET